MLLDSEFVLLKRFMNYLIFELFETMNNKLTPHNFIYVLLAVKIPQIQLI